MKTLTKTFITLLFMATISWPMISSSQQWSTEQQEVWELSEKMEKFWVQRDLDGYMSCLHENFIGWYGDAPLPIDKNSLRNSEDYNLSHQKIHIDEIKPVSITVTDNVAIVNYYKTARREDENGNRITYRKVTRICIKENGKWLILGNFAAAINEG
jgi:hypothetical protein